MVAFGTYLTSFRNPAWADKYVDYELLKSNIYAIEAALNSLPEGERTRTKTLPQRNLFF